MKNLILPIALATILLTSCSKDDSTELIEEQNIQSVIVLKQTNDYSYWNSMDLNVSERSSNYSNNITVETNGYYQPISRNGMHIKWTGNQNEIGIQGRAELKQESPNSSFHFKLVTECVTVNGNEAVYGGIITQVLALSGETPNISEGWKFYFKVIDGHMGNDQHIPYDKIATTTLFAPPTSPALCDVFLNDNSNISSQEYTVVTQPGFVEVYN